MTLNTTIIGGLYARGLCFRIIVLSPGDRFKKKKGNTHKLLRTINKYNDSLQKSFERLLLHILFIFFVIFNNIFNDTVIVVIISVRCTYYFCIYERIIYIINNNMNFVQSKTLFI